MTILKTSIILLLLVLFSCGVDKSTRQAQSFSDVQVSVSSTHLDQAVKAADLLKTNCYTCHNPNSKSHDEILAPPLAGIKMKYQKFTNGKDEFINRMTAYVLNPNEDDALMWGPIKRFGVMPKTALEEKQVKAIVQYIYENEIEKPVWFDEHHENKGHGKAATERATMERVNMERAIKVKEKRIIDKSHILTRTVA